MGGSRFCTWRFVRRRSLLRRPSVEIFGIAFHQEQLLTKPRLERQLTERYVDRGWDRTHSQTLPRGDKNALGCNEAFGFALNPALRWFLARTLKQHSSGPIFLASRKGPLVS